MAAKKSLLLLIVFIFLSSGSGMASAPSDQVIWQSLAPGIDYLKFELPDPNDVFVARMDRAIPSVTLESTIGQGVLAGGYEAVSDMYARYNQALNVWGANADPPDWSMRNQAVIAINGSYYDRLINMPQGGQIQSGWYAKRYDDYGGWSGFVWKLDRTAFIGKCVYHDIDKQLVTYPGPQTQRIDGINVARGTDSLIIYTPQYNSRTGTGNDADSAEVVVQMARPTLILPSPSYAIGYVRQIYTNTGNHLIPFDSIVLSATTADAYKLLQNVEIGTEIHISQEIATFEDDCLTPNSLSWTKAYAAIQGAFYFLENGVIHDFSGDPGAATRNPRTAIAYNNQYIFYIVVDGRDNTQSIGMTIAQLALFTRDTLQATYAVAEDGGGSSTMVVNGAVVNDTACNIYGCNYHFYLPTAAHDGAIVLTPPAPRESDVIIKDGIFERRVANGMLMVVAQPGEFSTAFAPGNSVITIAAADLRLGPGTNYASFATIPNGTTGTIVHQVNNLDGVLAKSTHWWYVSFGSQAGWVAEPALAHH